MVLSFMALGECMVELSDQGDGLYRRGFAGDTFNTAWYARHVLPFEWQVHFGSCIGSDEASHQMRVFMEDAGIGTTSLRVIPDQTVGLYMIDLHQGERHFSYWRSQSAARRLADDPSWLRRMLSGHKVIYFSGITLAILPPEGRLTLCAALLEARKGGAIVAFDTNLRPQLWKDHATMQAAILEGARVADIILPSFDEEQMIFAGTSAQEAIERYRTAGARVIVLKDGVGDVRLWDEVDGLRILNCDPVANIVDSTAAGDSFGGAFVAHLVQGATIEDAAKAAMLVAREVIQYRGALVPEIFKGGK